MSKFKDFLEQFDGQGVEVVDASNRNQCFDLVVAWLDWLNLPRTFNHLYAYSIYENATDGTKSGFDLIPNTPDAIPLEGDVVVWAKSYNGTAGHTGIATGEGNTDTFKAFEQNDPTGTVSHVKEYSYDHVIGWLRPKVYEYDEVAQLDDWKKSAYDRALILLKELKLLEDDDSNLYKDDEGAVFVKIRQLIIDNENHHRGYEEFKEKYEQVIKDEKVIITLHKEKIAELTKIMKDLEKEKSDAEKKNTLLQTEMETALAKGKLDCQSDLTALKQSLQHDHIQEVDALKKQIETLEKEGVIKEVLKETPLADRFTGKTLKEKIIGILEILGAK